MIDNIIILLLIIGAFIAGMKISDHYNRQISDYLDYVLRIQAAQQGVGYIARPRRSPISQEFMDKLRKEGRAVQQIAPDVRG